MRVRRGGGVGGGGSFYQRGGLSEGGNHDFTRVGAAQPLKKTEAASLPRPAQSGQL